MEMEPTVCPLCESGEARTIYTDRIKGIANEFVIVRCAACSMAYTNPVPTTESVAHHYSSSSLQAGLDAAHRKHSQEFLRSLSAQRMKSVEELCPPGKPRTNSWVRAKLLDVGCGFGEFAAFAQERGWQAYGTELAPTRIEAARQLLGKDRVFDTDVDGIPDGAGPFNVITTFHVLEHVRNPLAFLRRLRDLLTPSGWLVVEVPNLGALRVRLRKKPLANQLHVTHFEPHTLRAVIEKSGFNVSRITGAENKGDPPSPLKRLSRRARLGLEEGIWRAFGVHLGTNLRATAQKR